MTPMRITLHLQIPTTLDATRTYAYLRDFSNATEWDAGTLSRERLSGDGGVGSTYRNVSSFAGQKVELTYTVERDERPVFVIVGRTETMTGRDTITVTPQGSGALVDYRAEFEIAVPWLIRPIVRLLLKRLERQTGRQLKRTLDSRSR